LFAGLEGGAMREYGCQRENMDELHDNFQCPYLANAVGVFFFTVQFETEHDNK
jgi:hypothetical protein